MTPGARLSAAMALLDDILAGEPAERVLTRWSRGSRFAGSRDRAAVRDLVFDGLRRRRSLAWRGGAETGRAILLAHQAEEGGDLDALCTGARFDPAPVSDAERARLDRDPRDAPDPVRLDYPDFLDAPLRAALGNDFEPVMVAMQRRAPLDLRVNALKASVEAALAALAADGFRAERLPQAPHALRLHDNPRLLGASRAYGEGLVELQDVSSQRAAAMAGAAPGMTVLDYCAGGGGKTLALAAMMGGRGWLMAWDASPRRMADLPERARRAGARVAILREAELRALGPACDLVMVDAPCSGSGAWRRKPEGKWRLTPDELAGYPPLQDRILDAAAAHVRPGGRVVYATCSLFRAENEERQAAFAARHPGWTAGEAARMSPVDGGDGFFVASFRAPGGA